MSDDYLFGRVKHHEKFAEQCAGLGCSGLAALHRRFAAIYQGYLDRGDGMSEEVRTYLERVFSDDALDREPIVIKVQA